MTYSRDYGSIHKYESKKYENSNAYPLRKFRSLVTVEVFPVCSMVGEMWHTGYHIFLTF
jgi:hypothetical protein